jgi:hypothetical protein
MPRPLRVIAKDIRNNWPKVNYAAIPYLEAMESLNSKNEIYGVEAGDDIVRYFLCNANTWRGAEAKRIKAELREMIK